MPPLQDWMLEAVRSEGPLLTTVPFPGRYSLRQLVRPLGQRDGQRRFFQAAVVLDRVDQPEMGYFLEVKSRTWSRRDAEYKADVATTLAEFLANASVERVTKDYVELVLDEGRMGV